MSFLDYILASFGVYEIKDEIKKKPQKHLAKQTCVNFASTKETKKTPVFESKNKMAIFCPKNTNEVLQIAKFLAKNQPVLVNVSSLPKNILQNCLDFLIGAKTALNATMKQLENGFFVMLPCGTELVNFLEEEQ